MSLSTRAEIEKDESAFWAFIYKAAEWLFGEGHCEDSLASDLEYAVDVLSLDCVSIEFEEDEDDHK